MITLFRRILIGVVFVLVIITGGLWVVSGQNPKPVVEEKYEIKIYQKNPEKFDELVSFLTNEGYDVKTNKQVKKTLTKPIAFKLYQNFHEDENPEWHAKNLKKKKIDTILTKNEEDKTYLIEIKKVFKTKEQAEAMVEKIRTITAIKFEMAEKTKEVPYTTNEVIISNLADQEAGDKIKEKVSSKVQDPERDITIDIMTTGEETPRVEESPESKPSSEASKTEESSPEKEDTGKKETDKKESEAGKKDEK